MRVDHRGRTAETQPGLGANQEGPPERDSRPDANPDGQSISTAIKSESSITRSAGSVREPTQVSTLDHFAMRLLTNCLNEATRRWWLKRAEDFLAARPRPDEYHGQATTEQLRDQWRRLTEVANACRARAHVSPLVEVDPDVRSVWDEFGGDAA